MLVTDDRLLVGRDLAEVARAAVRGGVTAIQLRLKAATPRELLRQARILTAAVEVPVLINDRPDVAAACGAGVHLGPDDLDPAMARTLLGTEAIIGASVGMESEVARGAAADYWGIGPWRVTSTKADAGAAIGAEGFRRIIARAAERPCIAIGGIRPEDIPLVRAAGGVGVAVVSGILGHDDIEAAARRYALG
jgi:thiamine-phosphate pyrophosphorylase